jgi:hypothetical protein
MVGCQVTQQWKRDFATVRKAAFLRAVPSRAEVSIEPVTRERVAGIQYELKCSSRGSQLVFEVLQFRVELYRLHGSDSSRRSNCDTADDSN